MSGIPKFTDLRWTAIQSGMVQPFESADVSRYKILTCQEASNVLSRSARKPAVAPHEVQEEMTKIAEAGKPIEIESHDVWYLTKDKPVIIHPPDVGKIRELKEGLLELGFKKQRYSELDMDLNFTHTENGVKVSTASPNSNNPGIHVYVRRGGKYPSDRAPLRNAETSYDGEETIRQFLKRIAAYKGEPPTNKGTIQNLIMEEVKKLWPFPEVPSLKRGRAETDAAQLKWSSQHHILDQNADMLNAWLKAEPPSHVNSAGAYVSQHTFTMEVFLDHRSLVIGPQISELTHSVSIDYNDPWVTPENIVALIKVIIEQDYELYKSRIKRVKEHEVEVESIKTKIAEFLPKE